MGVIAGVAGGFVAAVLTAANIGMIAPEATVVTSVVFLAAWLGWCYAVMKGAASAARVLSRSFLLWAVLFLVLIPSTFIGTSRTALEATEGDAIGVAVSGTAMAIGAVLWVALAVGCLLLWLVTRLVSHEFRAERTASPLP
jgi:hypothetical protein